MAKTAIIIGAGPAGLTAAYELLKKTDIHPIILEQSSILGGISCTIDYKGNRIDLGGHRFFSKDDRVVKIWTDLLPVQGRPAIDDKLLATKKEMPKDGPDPEKTDRVMLIRTRISRIFYLRKFFDYPISIKIETFFNMGFIRTAMAGFGYIWSSLFKLKENSLKDFMINRFGKSLYEMFFADYTEKVWGKKPEDISAEWGTQRIKGLSLKKAIVAVFKKPFIKNSINNKNVETSLIEQFIYPKKGPGQLWEAMADEILNLGGEIYLNSRVVKINSNVGIITSVLIDDSTQQKEINGDIFISTMPVKDLIEDFDCPVPEDVREIAINLPYRDFMTVGLLVKKLKLKNTTKNKTLNNIIPDCWIYIQDNDVKLGRIQIFNNWSPYMVNDFENTIWMGLEYFCNEGDNLWKMNDEDFIDFAIDELCKINIIDKSDVIESTRLKVIKAYPAYFGSYEHFGKVIEYLDGFKNLYCIGRNGQHKYNNMDHSMLTAIKAVEIIKSGNTDKASIWGVNTEDEYHEKA